MKWQYNKVVNLRLASARLDGIILRPGETFSFWRLVGKPSRMKGYLNGVTLQYGKVVPGCGGGLCQLSNLIYWMTLHTPLTVTERHRHGYDVFPDASRTQPFGSGATCFFPYGDLMIKNTTDRAFQLRVCVGEENLEGEWRSDQPSSFRYEVIEKNHLMTGEYWGGFSRHNELYRRVFDTSGNLINEEYITENHALLMYAPFIA
jgi:vancomycin resistance protein VanW